VEKKVVSVEGIGRVSADLARWSMLFVYDSLERIIGFGRFYIKCGCLGGLAPIFSKYILERSKQIIFWEINIYTS